jgi:hypothetical protein
VKYGISITLLFIALTPARRMQTPGDDATIVISKLQQTIVSGVQFTVTWPYRHQLRLQRRTGITTGYRRGLCTKNH